MIRRATIAAAFALALTLAAGAEPAQVQRDEIERVVKDYLAKHPEEVQRVVKDYLLSNPQVLQEVLTELMRRNLPTAADRAALVRSHAAQLFHAPTRPVLGNANGDVTLVEFVDYNCGFCRRALGDVLDLMKADADLRVVLIDLPVLGAGSLEAARVAIAVQTLDRSAARYLEFHRRLLAGPGPANKTRALAVATELGFDVARLEQVLARHEIALQIEDNKALARSLGIRGTPSYVVGENILFGAVGPAALKDKIAAARQKP